MERRGRARSRFGEDLGLWSNANAEPEVVDLRGCDVHAIDLSGSEVVVEVEVDPDDEPTEEIVRVRP